MESIRKIRASEGYNFGNARSMRNYFEKVISNQANRLISEGNYAAGDGEDLIYTESE